MLDEEVDVLAMKADQFVAFPGDFETELIDVKGCRLFGIRGLDEDVGTKGVSHSDYLQI
jgi:hypothetical protein